MGEGDRGRKDVQDALSLFLVAGGARCHPPRDECKCMKRISASDVNVTIIDSTLSRGTSVDTLARQANVDGGAGGAVEGDAQPASHLR